MSRMVTGVVLLFHRRRARAHADDARDPAALDDEPRLGRLDGDVVLERLRRAAVACHRLPHMNDLADDATGGDDLTKYFIRIRNNALANAQVT